MRTTSFTLWAKLLRGRWSAASDLWRRCSHLLDGESSRCSRLARALLLQPLDHAQLPNIGLDIPVLETPRLRLRGFTPADFEPWVGFYASAVSATYGGPCGRDEAWRKFAVFSGHWALRGYGPWALELKATGELVGLSGLWFPEGWVEPEITWALLPGHHGHGYATEGAQRALQAAYEHFGWRTAVSVVAVGNEASAAVARRLGAALEATIPFRGGEGWVFRHRGPHDQTTLG